MCSSVGVAQGVKARMMSGYVPRGQHRQTRWQSERALHESIVMTRNGDSATVSDAFTAQSSTNAQRQG
jgi:hypothetical protein